MAKWYGMNFPFFKGRTAAGRNGVAERQEDSRLIKNDLIQGLLTLKGERLFRQGFGGDIGRFVFDINDAQTRSEIEDTIRSQIERFHPRIILNNINVYESADNGNALVVDLYGRTNLDAINKDELLASFQIPVSGTLSTERAISRTSEINNG